MSGKAICSADLGIDLRSGKERELFKWFLACLLFGKPIQQGVARRTYGEFVKEGLLTPEAILRAGWDKLVEVLDRGHYVRYDFSTATKLLSICRSLQEHYGTVTGLLDQARNRAELSRRPPVIQGHRAGHRTDLSPRRRYGARPTKEGQARDTCFCLQKGGPER
jgi:hypothetical protein